MRQRISGFCNPATHGSAEQRQSPKQRHRHPNACDWQAEGRRGQSREHACRNERLTLKSLYVFEHLLPIECEMFPAGSSIRNTGLELSSSSLEGCGVFRRQTFAQGMEELSSGIVGLTL